MNQQNNDVDDESRITIKIDPETKRKFKAFCALKETTQKDYLTICVEKAIESMGTKK